MGIRTNDELGGTIGGDTTGTDIPQDDGTIKRGLDTTIIDPETLADLIKKTNDVPVNDVDILKLCELRKINETLSKIEIHLSIISDEEKL